MTLVNVIETLGRLCIGSEVISICIVPRWLAVNESPLAVSMVMGGMSLRDWKSSRFPDRWLDAAESTSHMCELKIDVKKAAVYALVVTLCGISAGGVCMLATMMKFPWGLVA